MRTQSLLFVAIAIILPCQLMAGIDAEFRAKVNAARPAFDAGRWNALGAIQYRSANRHALDNIAQGAIGGQAGVVAHVQMSTGGTVGGPGAGILSYHPFQDCASLAFASSVEGLKMDKVINTNNGLVKLYAHMGTAAGGVASVRSVFAYTSIILKQQYTQQTVQKCKKKFFRKKCWNEVLNHPRGFNHDEINVITQGTISFTLERGAAVFNGLNQQPEVVSQDQIVDLADAEFETIQHTRIIRGVKRENLGLALKSTIGSISETKSDLLNDASIPFDAHQFLETNESGSHHINIVALEEGLFDIEVNSF